MPGHAVASRERHGVHAREKEDAGNRRRRRVPERVLRGAGDPGVGRSRREGEDSSEQEEQEEMAAIIGEGAGGAGMDEHPCYAVKIAGMYIIVLQNMQRRIAQQWISETSPDPNIPVIVTQAPIQEPLPTHLPHPPPAPNVPPSSNPVQNATAYAFGGGGGGAGYGYGYGSGERMYDSLDSVSISPSAEGNERRTGERKMNATPVSASHHSRSHSLPQSRRSTTPRRASAGGPGSSHMGAGPGMYASASASTSREPIRPPNPLESTPPKDPPTPSTSKPPKPPPSKTRPPPKKSPRRKKDKDKPTTPISAFLFPSTSLTPEIISIPCRQVRSEFEGRFVRVRYKDYIRGGRVSGRASRRGRGRGVGGEGGQEGRREGGGGEVGFKSLQSWRGMFLVVFSDPSSSPFRTRTGEENGDLEEEEEEENACIARLSEGRARGWKGNVLVFKQLVDDGSGLVGDPVGEGEGGGGMLGDVSMDDLGVLRSFFVLYGNVPHERMDRELYLKPPEGYPFPIAHPANTYPIDALLLPTSSPTPLLTEILCQSTTHRPTRTSYEQILGPDPHFESVQTYAGGFMIGFTSASRVGDRDLNGCVRAMSGGGGMEVRGDVVVFKEVGMGRGAGVGVYGDRYFRLWGHVSPDVLNESLMSP
ncbi:hypothetical protein SISNIDRAFT_461852 [Sistotremastrum niveocremeum HHB9708]|uniref:Uncharacterized protein n=1 Tax=Sistotremastrum niveocremeum HHB9708 TaxID=1314777 RepID=A0A165AET7_9AGAM|nr:hypothetical protein SISNIDRAFT_461852 [Sistotremastrum niveocremeum HHB9708]